MGKLLKFLIIAGVIFIGMDVAGLVLSGAKDPPSDAYTSLTTPPPEIVASTMTNGYFMLLGFAAGPKADPTKIGFDMWVDTENPRGHLYYDYTREPRADLQIQPDMIQRIQYWKIEDLLTPSSQRDETIKSFMARYSILLDRYEQWMTMSFDDEGYGHPGSPRLADLYSTHRVYLAVGFGQGINKGVERLEKVILVWRQVLSNAKTLPIKVLAAVVVNDTTRIASVLVSQQPDEALFKRLSGVMGPLSAQERSLRWQVQHEFVTGLSRYKKSVASQAAMPRQQSDETLQWLAGVANLNTDAFQRVTHPAPIDSRIARAMATKQRSINTYAAYYDALIQASETPPIKLPKLQEIAKKGPRSMLDPILIPVQNLFTSGQEPAWEPFIALLWEIDARLRLAGLQVIIRTSPPQQPIATTVAQAGPQYYDPFSGIPMVWNNSQGILYSVGKDGRDDGGENTFDVSVKVVTPGPPVPPKPPAKQPTKPARGMKPKPKPAPKGAAPKTTPPAQTEGEKVLFGHDPEPAPAPPASAPPAPPASTPPAPPASTPAAPTPSAPAN